MADYKHGSMDTSAQEATFAGFVKASIWVGALSIGALIFMAIFNS